MGKICFIGDSHLAAIKMGWPVGASGFLDATPTYFASPGKGMQALAVGERALVCGDDYLKRTMPLTSGGLAEIDASYDFYVIYGLRLTIQIALDAWADVGRGNREPGALRRAIAERVRQSIAVQTLGKLRQIAPAPAFLAPGPLSESFHRKLRAEAQTRGKTRAIAVAFTKACARVASGCNARFVDLPRVVLADDGLAVRNEYFAAPARFRTTKVAINEPHADARYGALMAGHILREISAR